MKRYMGRFWRGRSTGGVAHGAMGNFTVAGLRYWRSHQGRSQTIDEVSYLLHLLLHILARRRSFVSDLPIVGRDFLGGVLLIGQKRRRCRCLFSMLGRDMDVQKDVGSAGYCPQADDLVL